MKLARAAWAGGRERVRSTRQGAGWHDHNCHLFGVALHGFLGGFT